MQEHLSNPVSISFCLMNLVKFHIDVGSCLQYNSTTLKSFMSYRRRERTLINRVIAVGQPFKTVQSITALTTFDH